MELWQNLHILWCNLQWVISCLLSILDRVQDVCLNTRAYIHTNLTKPLLQCPYNTTTVSAPRLWVHIALFVKQSYCNVQSHFDRRSEMSHAGVTKLHQERAKNSECSSDCCILCYIKFSFVKVALFTYMCKIHQLHLILTYSLQKVCVLYDVTMRCSQ